MSRESLHFKLLQPAVAEIVTPADIDPAIRVAIESAEGFQIERETHTTIHHLKTLEGTAVERFRVSDKLGSVSLWSQLEGQVALRSGGMVERSRNRITAKPGDRIHVSGRGRLSLEEEVGGRAQGILTTIIPAPSLLDAKPKPSFDALTDIPVISAGLSIGLNHLGTIMRPLAEVPKTEQPEQQPERPEVTMQDLRPLFASWEREDPGAVNKRTKLLMDVEEGIISPEEAQQIVLERLNQLEPRHGF